MAHLSKILASLSLVTAFGALAACGGGDSPPKPLSRHFEDTYLAAIDVSQKQAMLDAKAGFDRAKEQNAKAKSDFTVANNDLEIARNDHKAAQLTVDSARATMKAAQASADTTRINDSTKEEHGAESTEKAAAARVKYVEAYRNWFHYLDEYTAEDMYWHEAQYELAKADLAQHNNIAPKGFVYVNFPNQEQDRKKHADARKRRSEDAHQHALDVRSSWLRAQEDAERETGRRNQYPDPLAPSAGAG
jgi:hypothetical protein